MAWHVLYGRAAFYRLATLGVYHGVYYIKIIGDLFLSIQYYIYIYTYTVR